MIITPHITNQPATISSAEASYDGQVLHLKDQVLLEHPLGLMSSGSAALKTPEEHAAFPFSEIDLEGRVHLQLAEKTELVCARAHLDFTKLQGNLYSDSADVVTYTKEVDPAMRLESHHIDVRFARKQETYAIEELFAYKEVLCTYAHLYVVKAHRALYKKTNAQEMLFAYPEEGGMCELTYKEDVVRSKEMTLDMSSKVVTLLEPQGVLKSLQGICRCDRLTMEDVPHQITLHGNISVRHSNWGDIDAEEWMRVIQEGPNYLILSKGKTVLTHLEATLSCYGELLLDQQNLVCYLSSKGCKQIHCQGPQGTLYADDAEVHYAYKEGGVQLMRIILKGNVLLKGQMPPQERLALADTVTYDVDAGTLILGAHSGNRVLFFDEERSVRMSAPEVRIIKDPVTHIENIQGIGSVRFSFTQQEDALLHPHRAYE